MRIYNNIELGYNYIDCCLYDMSKFTIYVLIPKQLNPEINQNILSLVNNDVEILGLSDSINISDYNIYEYYEIFSTLTNYSKEEPRSLYTQVLKKIKNMLIPSPEN